MPRTTNELTKDQADGLLYGGLVGELGLEERGREKVSKLGGLVPTHVLVVDINLSQPEQKEGNR